MSNKRRKYESGDKVYIIDRIDVFGREFLAIEPATIERCYIDDEDFIGDYLVRLDYNGKSVGEYVGNMIKRK